jgi:DNA-binding NarL/FixJ family response regulator
MRIVLVGRDSLARAGLLNRLGDAGEVTVTRELAEGEEIGLAVLDSDSTAILWDLGPSTEPVLDGLAAAAAEGSAPILALVGPLTAVRPALAAGALGALPRDAPPGQIAVALAAIRAGLQVLVPEPRMPRVGAAEPIVEALTPRGREVLELMAEGLPNKLIADRLRISENTAKFHVNSILGKLGAESRTEAVVRAARLGWIAI